MKNSNSNDWLIPLFAAFAIYLPFSTTAPSPDQQASAHSQSPALIQVVPTPTPTPAPGPGRVPGEGARLLCDFFGLEPEQDHNVGLNPQQKSEAENRRGDYCQIKSVLNSKTSKRPSPLIYDEIEYLIATLPDPKDSSLDHQFDRALDAIRRAIESADFTFDRFWLPWDRSKTAAPPMLATDPKAAQMATRHLRDPGVILFRGSKSKRLLLLFLVGETPTGGIHRVAFQNALRQIEELPSRIGSKAEEPAKEKPLRILGPNFSGSADSLALLLKAWIRGLSPPPKVTIITGNATAINEDEFLKKIDTPGINYYSTILNSQQASDEFYKYLMDRDPQIKSLDDAGSAGARIALLSEVGTGYGQNIRQKMKEALRKFREKQALQDVKRNENQPSTGAAPKLDPPVLSLTFPLHISQLRVEEAKNPLRDNAANAPAAKDGNLPLPMGEAGAPGSKDTAPLFSSLETVTMELALREMLSVINRERIRYVGVWATDPQDRIFLIHEIRKHCPNAMIFMFATDLLYLHSESNLDFQGVLVISPYPLFGLNQFWTYPFEGGQRRLQFSSNSAQGYYNATLALLCKEDRMLEYGLPFNEYRDGQSRHPVLWLGIVGRNGIWPVKTFDISHGTSHTFSVPNKSCPPVGASSSAGPSSDAGKAAPRLGVSGSYWSPTGAGSLLLIAGVCLFLSLTLLAQLAPFWGRSRMDRADSDQWMGGQSKLSRAIIGPILKLARQIERGSQWALLRRLVWIRRGFLGQVFGDEEFYCYRLDHHINLLGCCISLLTASLFISGVAMLPAWILLSKRDGEALQTGWGRHWVIGVMACMILVFTLGAFIWLMVSLSRWMVSGWRHFHGRIWVLLALVAGVAMITLVGWGLFEVFFEFKRPEQVFFFLRATELTSGVSVLLPALLIGLAAFLSFFAALRRYNLAERMPCLRNPRQRLGDAPQFLRFDHERAQSFEGLKALEDRVKEMIVCPISKVPGVAHLSVLIAVVYFLFFQQQFIPSVDGRQFDWFFILAFCVVPLMLVWALMRFFWLWAATKRLLRRLSWHPLISQFAARHSEEKRFASIPHIDLMTPTPTYSALSLSVRQARSFCNALKLGPGQVEERKRIGQLVEEAESELSHSLESDAKGDWQKALRKRRYSQAALAELTERVSGLLEDSWRATGGAHADAAWRDEGKFFLIAHIVAFLQHVFAHLQNLVGLVTMGLLLMLLAAISYPFQPREPLLLFSTVAILTSVVVTLFIFVSASRDKTLSLLSGTAPGKVTVTRDLVFRVLVHGVVPLIALLGVQFPEAVRQIFSWLKVFEGKGA
jgi:hypothetical protein